MRSPVGQLCITSPSIWRALLGAAGLLALSPAWAQAPVQRNSDVQFGLLSQKDPHPLTYAWNAEVKPITDPGANFYYFFYTGTVGPDARISTDDKIQRIPVPLIEWANEKKYILAKLTYFYQVTNNQAPTTTQEFMSQGGLNDLGAAAPAAGGGAGGDASAMNTAAPMGGVGAGAALPAPAPAPGMPGADATAAGGNGLPAPGDANGANPAGFPPAGAPGAQPDAGQNNGFSVPSQAPAPGGMAPNMTGYSYGGPTLNSIGGGNSNFDARSAAEWTFYIDQYVLWEYYCSRNLLGDKNDKLLDQSASAMAGGAQQSALSAQGQATMNAQLGVLGQGNVAAGGVGAAAGAAGRPGARQGGGIGNIGTFIDNQTGDFYAQHGAATGQGNAAAGGGMGGGGSTGVGGSKELTVREYFDLAKMKDAGTNMRTAFMNAAKQNEDKIYKTYMEMINRIDQRQVNQEQYDEWVRNKRAEILDYAENWRKLDDGDAQVIKDTMFLITKEPLETVPYDAVNVVKGEQVTPQDLLNADGTVKQPEIK